MPIVIVHTKHINMNRDQCIFCFWHYVFSTDACLATDTSGTGNISSLPSFAVSIKLSTVCVARNHTDAKIFQNATLTKRCPRTKSFASVYFEPLKQKTSGKQVFNIKSAICTV